MGGAEYYDSKLFLRDLAREWMLDEAPKIPGISPETCRQIEEYNSLTGTDEADLWDELESLFDSAWSKPIAAPKPKPPRPKPPRTRRFRRPRNEGRYWDEPAL